jgi:hypothetical protein
MIRTYTPRARVEILLSKHSNEPLDVSDDLFTLQTSKKYGNAAGGWEITLPHRQIRGKQGLGYYDLISPDDIVTIEMDAGDGQGFELVMLGVVSRVARTLSSDGNGAPRRAIKINGADNRLSR